MLNARLARASSTFAMLLAVSFVFAPAAPAAPPATTIDFSTVSQGPFDQSFFKKEGVVFTEGSFVGFVQSHNALIGPVAGDVRGGFARLSAEVAPDHQGTATYTLAAFDKGKQIQDSITVTQDTGDPTTGPPGYFAISIGPLSQAGALSLTNVFVRSSFPDVTEIGFGVRGLLSRIRLNHRRFWPLSPPIQIV